MNYRKIHNEVEKGYDHKVWNNDSTSKAFSKQMLSVMFAERFAFEATNSELFKKFKRVRVSDSSIIEVPKEFNQNYPECGNQNGSSTSLKLQANLELKTREVNFEISSGKTSDHNSTIAFLTGEDELSVRDLGYYSLIALEMINRAKGYFLSRTPIDQIFYHNDGHRLSAFDYLSDGFDQIVKIQSKTVRLLVRLLVFAVPCVLIESRALNRKQNDAVNQSHQSLFLWQLGIFVSPMQDWICFYLKLFL